MKSVEQGKYPVKRRGPKRMPEKVLTQAEKLDWAFKRLGIASPYKDETTKTEK